MLNAKRIFFILVTNGYEAFDFSAAGFIQLLIRNAHRPRAGSNALMLRNMLALRRTEEEEDILNQESRKWGFRDRRKSCEGSSERVGR
jgi:hypothetical protein